MTDAATIARRARCLAFDIGADRALLHEDDLIFTRTVPAAYAGAKRFTTTLCLKNEDCELTLEGVGTSKEASLAELRRAVDRLFPAETAVQ